MNSKEAIYDTSIAPLMAQVIDLCKANGIPLFATFQYDSDSFCSTVIADGDAHPAFRHYEAIRQSIEGSGVNIDKYMNWNAKAARVSGHSSIWLRQAGIPATPTSMEGERSE